MAVVHILRRTLDEACLSTDLGSNLKRPGLGVLMLRMHERRRTSLCGRPAAEKMGIFWPRAIEFMVSIVEIPVWIISSGYMRE